VSSPNTRGLRDLQQADELDRLLAALKREQGVLAQAHGRHVPLAVKVAPDLDTAGIGAIADALKRHRVEAVIATNTTVSRDGVGTLPHAAESGGLSGAPLTQRATGVVRQLANDLAGAVPVIGVGGIMTANDAREKIAAGAQLVQLYTGLVYRGPELVHECVDALCTAK
jgi:dihydroorotate dehydrogenase